VKGVAGTGGIQARGGLFGQPQNRPAVGASQNLGQLRDRREGEEASKERPAGGGAPASHGGRAEGRIVAGNFAKADPNICKLPPKYSHIEP
jgi:hypothetical protein